MQNFHGYMCDGCGFAREKPGQCPFCQAPLSVYSKVELINDLQMVTEDESARKVKSEYKWYA